MEKHFEAKIQNLFQLQTTLTIFNNAAVSKDRTGQFFIF